MKRIYNDIPLQSILYLIPGTTKVIVEDYTRQGVLWENSEPVYKWEGMACRATTSLLYKYTAAKVWYVVPCPDDPGTLLFKISTEFEQY